MKKSMPLTTQVSETEDLKHECGVFGVVGSPTCLADCQVGQNAQQYRGEEWNGHAFYQDGAISIYKYPGLVSDNHLVKFEDNPQGEVGISHIRYCTQGASTYENAQPHLSPDGQTTLCSNGDIPPEFYQFWRLQMDKRGFGPISDNDGELILCVIRWRLSEGDDIRAAIRYIQMEVVGAYSALVIHQGKLYAFRDRLGMRPLVFGRKRTGKFYVASETCALDDVGVRRWKVVAPGSIVAVNPDGSYREYHGTRVQHAHCVFCNIYFGGITSVIFGIANIFFRKDLGRRLKPMVPPNADIIIAVPDSSNAAALGLSQATGLPLELGLIRRHYNMGRSFTAPNQETRDRIVRTKLVANPAVVRDQVVVVVDDSIVRGTTSRRIVKMLFRAGAKEVHLLITSPKITHPCFYGIDTPDKKKLIGSRLSVEQIRQKLGATTLAYLTEDDLRSAIRAANRDDQQFCFACFNGQYPTPLRLHASA